MKQNEIWSIDYKLCNLIEPVAPKTHTQCAKRRTRIRRWIYREQRQEIEQAKTRAEQQEDEEEEKKRTNMTVGGGGKSFIFPFVSIFSTKIG